MLWYLPRSQQQQKKIKSQRLGSSSFYLCDYISLYFFFHSCQSKYSQPSFDLLSMFETSLSEISINLMLNVKMFGQKKENWIWIICLHWFAEVKTDIRANAPDKTWGILYIKKSMPDIGKQIFSTISQIVLNDD